MSLLSFAFLTGCATLQASYEPFSEQRRLGYVDKKTEDLNESVKFYGNMFTEPMNMVLFAEFRAIEVCSGRGLQARFLALNDLSPSQSIQSGEGYANYVPPYLKYDVSFAAADGVRSDVINGSIEPVFEVIYYCTNSVYTAQVNVREVSAESVRLVAQDLRGAVQLNSFQEESINKTNLKPDDLILKINGERTKTKNDFFRQNDQTKAGAKALYSLVREQKMQNVEVALIDVKKEAVDFNKKIVSLACAQEEMKNNPRCLK